MSSPRSIRSVDDDGEGMDLGDMFVEPERPKTPPPTFASYTRPESIPSSSWDELSIRLVGEHPLWGQHLWNAARVFATYLLENADSCLKDKKVLELGAAGALPGIISTLSGASVTVITDYPDDVLIDNMQYNVDLNVPEALRSKARVLGHCWGKSVQPLLACLPTPEDRFDTVILSDLVFNHSQHAALLDSCNASTHALSNLLVFYTHHRPHLADADVAFFDMARERGWESETIREEWTGPMFENDRGDAKVRGTVWGWRCWRKEEGAETEEQV